MAKPTLPAPSSTPRTITSKNCTGRKSVSQPAKAKASAVATKAKVAKSIKPRGGPFSKVANSDKPRSKTSAKKTKPKGEAAAPRKRSDAAAPRKKIDAAALKRRAKPSGEDAKPKKMKSSSDVPKPKRKTPVDTVRITEKETQTSMSKATQTRDWTVVSKEAQFLQSLKEENIVDGDIPEHVLDIHPVDIRIPQLTLADMLKYAKEHGCEIRIS